jgi:hypothetical protein
MRVDEKISKYLNEEQEEEYDLTFDERMEDDVEKLLKKVKGYMDDPDYDYGDARTNAYIPMKYKKQFEKALDKLGVDWN